MVHRVFPEVIENKSKTKKHLARLSFIVISWKSIKNISVPPTFFYEFVSEFPISDPLGPDIFLKRIYLSRIRFQCSCCKLIMFSCLYKKNKTIFSGRLREKSPMGIFAFGPTGFENHQVRTCLTCPAIGFTTTNTV